MMKLRINPLVVKDLKDIRDFIAEDNAQKASEIVDEILRKFENIQLFPRMGYSVGIKQITVILSH